MSFSSETKNELARIIPEKTCCELAEIAGFIRVSGRLGFAGRGGFKVTVSTDNAAVARHYKVLIQDYFKIEPELKITEAQPPKKGYIYHLGIDPDMRSDSILRETGILLVRQGNNYLSDGIYNDIIRTKCCRRAYLRGVFLGAGTITDPQKGYHYEVSCDSQVMANDLKKMLNTFVDITAKVVERKGRYVVYLKNSQQISDVLALMGAHSQMLNYENTKIKKELVNRTMRITNCDNANTDRTLNASQNQVEGILKLKEMGRFDSLSAKLKELAELRLENPEASLTQLGEMMDPPLKKSGVNNRMKRILELLNK